MAQRCAVCGKKSIKGWYRVKLRGKYNPTAKRRQWPNLQWLFLTPELAQRLDFPGKRRIKACTKCIKALGKTRMPQVISDSLKQPTQA